MTCLSGVKFNMIATVIRNYTGKVVDENQVSGFKDVYDELTGEVKSVYEAVDLIPNDTTDAPTMEVFCIVSPSYTVTQANDVRYQGTRVIDTERLTMKVPSKYHLYTTDRVTNIRTKLNELIYEDDQNPARTPQGFSTPAVYNVVGVLPVTDPFGNVVERQIQLEKVNS